jgi:hypothetical protein
MRFEDRDVGGGRTPGALRIVNPDPRYTRVHLIEPTTRGYLYLAARVGTGTLPVVLPSSSRSRLIHEIKDLAHALGREEGVISTHTFRAIVRPPTGRLSAYLKERRTGLRTADFDVMVLIQTTSPADAERIQRSRSYAAMAERLTRAAGSIWSMRARNVKRIADVDTSPGGLFLFNHFVAEDRTVMFDLWDYLACWYRVETGLASSVAMVPADGEPSDYAIVNWARWDASPAHHFWTQLSKRSFWRYVVRNLDANRAAAMPIYCRLA